MLKFLTEIFVLSMKIVEV